MVKASANHSYNRTRRLAELIGSKPARTWRVGTAWATPHRATAPAAMYTRTVATAPIITYPAVTVCPMSLFPRLTCVPTSARSPNLAPFSGAGDG